MGPGANDHDAARIDVKDDEDRDIFVRTQGEGCARSGFRVHAWVLMRNQSLPLGWAGCRICTPSGSTLWNRAGWRKLGSAEGSLGKLLPAVGDGPAGWRTVCRLVALEHGGITKLQPRPLEVGPMDANGFVIE